MSQDNTTNETTDQDSTTVMDTELTGIAAKQASAKETLIDQLRKTPIIQIACEKASIGRSTFYRWKKEDQEFSTAVESAINSGADLVSDMAESKLVSSIKEGNMTAIMFWLKNRHKSYATKLEMVNSGKPVIEQLTPEQEAIVQKALELATFTLPEDGSGQKPTTDSQPQASSSSGHDPSLSTADNPDAGTTISNPTIHDPEQDPEDFATIPLG